MWFDVLLLVLGLVLPPLYVVVLGRMYVKRCEILFQLIRNYGCDCRCCTKRNARPTPLPGSQSSC